MTDPVYLQAARERLHEQIEAEVWDASEVDWEDIRLLLTSYAALLARAEAAEAALSELYKVACDYETTQSPELSQALNVAGHIHRSYTAPTLNRKCP